MNLGSCDGVSSVLEIFDRPQNGDEVLLRDVLVGDVSQHGRARFVMDDDPVPLIHQLPKKEAKCDVRCARAEHRVSRDAESFPAVAVDHHSSVECLEPDLRQEVAEVFSLPCP